MVKFNDTDTLYHFIRVAKNCPKFGIECNLPMILEEDFQREYPDMISEIFSELVIAYYQGYGY